MKKKNNILIFAKYFWPAFKAGGPVRSVLNLVQTLSNDYDFSIVSRDRDSGDRVSFPGIQVWNWNVKEHYRIFYSGIGKLKNCFTFVRIFFEEKPQILYINSFFDPLFSILPLFINMLFRKRAAVVLAPRGEFSEGALKINPLRKKIYTWFFKRCFLKDIIFHATSMMEQNDIHRQFGLTIKVEVVPNIVLLSDALVPRRNKKNNELSIVYLSRVSPKKNLLYALEILSQMKHGAICFDIWGYIDDQNYWRECQLLIEKLPANITAKYRGVVKHENVVEVLQRYHVFFLPTHGENFGHVILEALYAGCLVLLSDQTPWLDLEELGIGWSIPLSKPEKFAQLINKLQQKDETFFNTFASFARTYSLKKMRVTAAVLDGYHKIFRKDKCGQNNISW